MDEEQNDEEWDEPHEETGGIDAIDYDVEPMIEDGRTHPEAERREDGPGHREAERREDGRAH